MKQKNREKTRYVEYVEKPVEPSERWSAMNKPVQTAWTM